MSKGLPDWSNVIQDVDVELVSDVQELAVRLGSFYTHLRTGNVLYMTSFEDSDASYFKTVSGTGTTISNYTSKTQSGAKALKLHVVVGSGGSATVRKHLVVPNNSFIGMQVSLAANNNEGTCQFKVTRYDGSNAYVWRVEYNRVNQTWKLTNLSDSQTLDTFAMGESNQGQVYDRVKMVLDVENLILKHVYLNATKHETNMVAVNAGADTRKPIIIVDILIGDNSSQDENLLIDDLIITTNEPI